MITNYCVFNGSKCKYLDKQDESTETKTMTPLSDGKAQIRIEQGRSSQLYCRHPDQGKNGKYIDNCSESIDTTIICDHHKCPKTWTLCYRLWKRITRFLYNL